MEKAGRDSPFSERQRMTGGSVGGGGGGGGDAFFGGSSSARGVAARGDTPPPGFGGLRLPDITHRTAKSAGSQMVSLTAAFKRKGTLVSAQAAAGAKLLGKPRDTDEDGRELVTSEEMQDLLWKRIWSLKKECGRLNDEAVHKEAEVIKLGQRLVTEIEFEKQQADGMPDDFASAIAGAASTGVGGKEAAAAAAAALVVVTAGQHAHDVEPRHSLEPHHAHGFPQHGGRLRAPQDLHREPVCVPHEVLGGPLHAPAERLVEPQPRRVRLVLGLHAHLGQAPAHLRRGVGVDPRVDLLDGQVAHQLGEERLVRRQQQDALAALARARRAPQAVDVLLAGGGQADLDDQGDVGVVEAARADVGGHHDAALGLAELVGGLGAVALALAAVDLRHLAVQRDEELGGELRGARSGEEADHLVHGLLLLVRGDELHQQVQVVRQGRDGQPLLHLQVGGGVVLAHAVHVGVPRAQSVGRDILHRVRHRGTEQQGLPLPGDVAEDLVDGGLESHLKQLVRLVQDQHLEVGAAGRQLAGLEVVDEAPGGSHQEVAALRVHAVALGVDVGAAEHALRLKVVEGEQRLGLLVDLGRELAGRGEHEDRDGVLARRGRFEQRLDGGE
mmetsp:Transcript_35224/g.86422  ORF Transcript_35224/g.86422 Transcript_35224/m.86422 type:complete len:614 (-) Transcript_35224:639-2480(-)